MKYLVTGLCDVFVKPRGEAGIVRFTEEHQFECDKLPTREELIKYAEERGYKIGLSRNGGMGILHGSKEAVSAIYRYL